MAFQQPTAVRHPTQQSITRSQESSSLQTPVHPSIEQSQEWVLFSPAQAESSTDKTHTTRTAGLSRASDFGTLRTDLRSGQLGSSVLEEDITEDGELDSLDDGLHAFREPPLYQTHSHQTNAPVLPVHDGLGSFQASSSLVLEQLWRHEQHNPKRKHEGHHRRPSSIQRRLDTVDELEAQANEEKRVRIEKWRLEQSQALIDEVEKATRARQRSRSVHEQHTSRELDCGTTPKQSDFMSHLEPEENANEPFWRRITRKFIRDVIGIDEPLLSVILGESLPGEETPRPSSPVIPSTIPKVGKELESDQSWRARLLERIAKELGVFVHQLSPHPGAFSTYSRTGPMPDYAGMPIPSYSISQHTSKVPLRSLSSDVIASHLTAQFHPTFEDTTHAESWGFEEEQPIPASTAALNIQKEREYWERELDVDSLLQFLKDRFITRNDDSTLPNPSGNDGQSASRAAIIRQHHPLVARAHRSPIRTRRDARLATRRPGSSCASESATSGKRANALRSGSSRNYWDIGGSVGSGSLLASGGLMGGWGEV